MRLVKIIGIMVILGALVFSAFGCKASAATTTTTVRTATVTKGTLTNSITGTGNLAYSTTQELTFDLHSFVDEVLVSEGDTVKKDQKLITLDTTDWDTQINNLTKTLSNNQRTLVKRQETLAKDNDTLATRQIALATAQRVVADKEFLLKQAQFDIDSATYNLEQVTEIKEAQDAIDKIQAQIDAANANLAIAQTDADRATWTQIIKNLNSDDIKSRDNPKGTGAISPLTAANNHLTAVKNLIDPTLSIKSALDIAKLELTLQQKQKTLQDATQAIADAKVGVDTAQANINYAQVTVNEDQLDVKDGQRDVNDAQKLLDDAKSLSPIIYAPFDGFITSIPVKGGDEVQKGKIGAIIADPIHFEADILVTETDINTIKLNGDATVTIDSRSMSFPAKITWIAPTASINSGVVNYHVTVTLSSLKPISSSQQSSQGSGGQPRPSPSAGGSGGDGGAPPPGGGGDHPSGGGAPPPGSGGGSPRPSSSGGSNTVQDATLKQGLSATVTIVSEQKTGILYVPSKAVVRQGGNMIVKVPNGTTIEARTVKTGMSDGTNTEIMEGLKEGETVNYNVTVTSASSSQSGLQLGGGDPPGGGGGGGGGGPPPPPPGGGGPP